MLNVCQSAQSMEKHSVNVRYSGIIIGQDLKTILMSLFYTNLKKYLELDTLV